LTNLINALGVIEEGIRSENRRTEKGCCQIAESKNKGDQIGSRGAGLLEFLTSAENWILILLLLVIFGGLWRIMGLLTVLVNQIDYIMKAENFYRRAREMDDIDY